MKPSTQRILSIVASVSLVLATVFVYVNLIIPAYDDIQKLRGELASKTALLSAEEKTMSDINKLVSQSTSISQSQAAVSLSLPIKEDVPSIVNQLQTIAVTSGVTISSVNVQTLALKPVSGELMKSIGPLRLQLRVTGPYAKMKSFIGDLETNARVMDIVNIDMSPSVKSSVDSYNANIVVDTYYQAQ